METIGVLLADADDMCRGRIRTAIEREADMEIVAEAADGESVLRLPAHALPDVALLPVSLPGVNGIKATRHILAKAPRVKVIGLIRAGPAVASEMLQAGARGCVHAEARADTVPQAIRAVMDGRTYISPEIGGAVFPPPQERKAAPLTGAVSAARHRPPATTSI